MKFQQFFDIVQALSPKTTILVRGRHGIGKSQSVYQLGEKWGLPVIERRLSQMTEGDMIGLPNMSDMDGEGVTRFNPPDWFMRACREPAVLFLDEINRATPEILQASFQVAGSRELNGNKLHEGTRVIAAINASAEYTVNDMDPALLDRFWVVDLDPDVKDWLAWAKEICHPLVYDFIQSNERHLEHTGGIEPGKVYPSRRSWEKVSRELDLSGAISKPSGPLFYGISFGLLGVETAQAFTEYAKSIDDQLSAEDVLDKWGKSMKARIEKFGNDKFNILIEKIGDYTGANVLTDKQTKNLVAFCSNPCFPRELLVSMWTSLVDRPDKKPENLRQYKGDLAELVMNAVDVNEGNKDETEAEDATATKGKKKK